MDAQASKVAARVLAERLADEIEAAERVAATDPIDPKQLRARLDGAMTVACALLDALPELGDDTLALEDRGLSRRVSRHR